jgi:hypothetical protein
MSHFCGIQRISDLLTGTKDRLPADTKNCFLVVTGSMIPWRREIMDENIVISNTACKSASIYTVLNSLHCRLPDTIYIYIGYLVR